MTVYGSLQCPYYVHRALMVALGCRAEQVRVVQTETGGGFGGKEEYPSVLACHAAILALKAGAPVKMIYDRVEDLLATTKRHPSIVRHAYRGDAATAGSPRWTSTWSWTPGPTARSVRWCCRAG